MAWEALSRSKVVVASLRAEVEALAAYRYLAVHAGRAKGCLVLCERDLFVANAFEAIHTEGIGSSCGAFFELYQAYWCTKKAECH